MLVMLRNNVHHLPLLSQQKVIGVVSLSDLVRHESQNSLLLVRGILSQESCEGLAELSDQVAAVMIRMRKEGANSHMVGTAMSVIGRAFKQRLLELAEQKLGPAPNPLLFPRFGLHGER